jgi:superfamily II DNA or RNA helicase
MGFWEPLIKEFRRKYDIKLIENRPARIQQNCIPDWSRLDPKIQFRANQREILEAMFAADRGRVVIPTACHAEGHPILMYDGTIKSVEDVAVGDVLMGADSTPRTVLSLCRGSDEMFRITPKRGEPFVVNKEHILSLVCTNEGNKRRDRDGNPFPCHRTGGEIDNISVGEYLLKSKSWKHLRKLRQVPVFFSSHKSVKIPPYILGILLGDGCIIHYVRVSNPDAEVIQALEEYAKSVGCILTHQWFKPHCFDVCISLPTFRGQWGEGIKRSKWGKNPVSAALHSYGLMGKRSGDKFIPFDYLTGSVSDRLELLAGLLDTDGCTKESCYDYISKSFRLATDIIYLARSLGFYVSMKECTKSCNGKSGTYYRVFISGETDRIPCRAPRKQAVLRKMKKDVLRQGFSVEPIGEGDYYGFLLDGDHLYLDGNFVAHHNSGKSFLIQQYISLLPKARIIVTTSAQSVLIQLWENINKVLLGKAGIICSSKKFNPDARVICVSTGTLQKFLKPQGEQDIDAVLCDEIHELGSKQRIELIENIREAKMFGFSANATRPDKAEFRINGLFGPVLATMKYEEAVDKKLVTPICVVWCPVQSNTDPTSFYDASWQKERYGIWRYEKRNHAIADAAHLFGEEEQVLITVKTIDHALHLHKLLPDYQVVYSPKDFNELNRFRYLKGVDKVPMMTKEKLQYVKKQFEHGTIKKIISTSVWSRGVNFPNLSVLIRADASNSCIADTQWPGRAARKQDGKEVSLVFDFTDEYSPLFHRKAMERRKRYVEHGWTQMTLQQLKEL